ncbi:hypothetical protein AHAS_Ahas11G0275600 [Arachis hypogaea]
MLKIDRVTLIHSRGRFARICVEIDLFKKLVHRISVFGSTLNIEYEGLHLICFSCGKYGHRLDQCTETSISEEVQKKTSTDGVQATVEADISLTESEDHAIKGKDSNSNPIRKENQDPPNFGPWMMVKRQIRRKSGLEFKGSRIMKDNQYNMGGAKNKKKWFKI